MSMSANVHSTLLQFCVDCDIDINTTISLLREIVDDMNGDGGETHDFSWVDNEYSRLKKRRPTADWSKRSACCRAGITCHCVKCGRSVKPR